MNIWLLKASEIMPISEQKTRLLRMGMIAEELSRRNHDVTWFSSTFDHFKKVQLYDKDTIIDVKKNYHIYLIHALTYKKNISVQRIIHYKRIAQKFRKISKTINKPDLIYVAFPTIDYATEAIRYGKKYNVPVVIDIRDLWPDIFYHNLPKYLRIIATPYIKWLNYKTKKIMKNAFAINAVSEAVLYWGLEKGKRNKGKYDQYFYIGYDKKNNENIEVTKNIENLIEKDKFNISFFATINNQFDYEKVAELAKNLEKRDKDVIINICGNGPQMEKLKELIKGVSNVRLLGWVENDTLTYILQNSKMGLAPYKNTFDFQMGVSNKFAEYISYGLPIILTSEGYMKKLLEENKCGMSTKDMNKMCDFIIELKNSPEEYKNMSNNALNLYQEKFVAEKIYQELVNYLEKIKEEI